MLQQQFTTDQKASQLNNEAASFNAISGGGTTDANTLNEKREMTSFASSGLKQDNFDFSQSFNTNAQQMEFTKSNFLKRGCPRLLSLTTKHKAHITRQQLQKSATNHSYR